MVFSDVFLGKMAFDFLILDSEVFESLVKVETVQFCACSVGWVGELTRVAHCAKSSFYWFGVHQELFQRWSSSLVLIVVVHWVHRARCVLDFNHVFVLLDGQRKEDLVEGLKLVYDAFFTVFLLVFRTQQRWQHDEHWIELSHQENLSFYKTN